MVKTVVSYTIAKGSIPFIDNYVRNYIPFKNGLFRWPYRLMVKTQRLQCCYTGSNPVRANQRVSFIYEVLILDIK
jgi:hypothetical protein